MSDWDRLAHDDEAGPLKLRDKALGDDLCRDLGGLISHQALAAGKRQGKADFDFASAGRRELVIVGHGQTIARWSERSKNNGPKKWPHLLLGDKRARPCPKGGTSRSTRSYAVNMPRL